MRCDSCCTATIRGIRYKYSICHDFHFCEEWEESKYHSHSFLKIKYEQDYKKYRKDLKRKFIKSPEVNEETKRYISKVIDSAVKTPAPNIENIISQIINTIIYFTLWNKF